MRNGQNTKEKIINISMQIFAQKGYDATTLDEIANLCDITKPAIYYHFKDKSSLYEYILCSQFEEMAKRVLQNTQEGKAEDRLKAYIKNFGQYLIDNPTFSAIFSREISIGGQTLPDGCIKELAKTLDRLSNILDNGLKEGVFKEINPFLVQMMIVTPLSAYHTSKPLRKKVAEVLNSSYLDVEFSDIVDNLTQNILSALKV